MFMYLSWKKSQVYRAFQSKFPPLYFFYDILFYFGWETTVYSCDNVHDNQERISTTT